MAFRFQPLLRHFVAALKANGKKNTAALATLKEILKKVWCGVVVHSICLPENRIDYPDRDKDRAGVFVLLGGDERPGYSFAIISYISCCVCEQCALLQNSVLFLLQQVESKRG